MFCLANTAQAVLFKILARRGLSVFDYQLYRNASITIAASFGMYYQNLTPMDGRLVTNANYLAGRVCAGQLNFLLLNVCI